MTVENINHERMLFDPAGVEPATPDNQSDAHPTEAARPVGRVI